MLLNSTAACRKKSAPGWLPAVQEVTDEQGGLWDGNVNEPWQQHTSESLEGKTREESSGMWIGNKNKLVRDNVLKVGGKKSEMKFHSPPYH